MDDRNFRYMFYGYTVAWLIIIVYALLLNLRSHKLRRELERVRRMVEESGKSRSQISG